MHSASELEYIMDENRLSKIAVEVIKMLYQEGHSISQLAKKYSLTVYDIRYIVKEISWKRAV